MVTLNPFRALRPVPEEAAQVCAPPYDVVSTDEARSLADGNPVSFLRITRPELEFPQDADPYSDVVYARGTENLQRLVSQGHLVRDASPSYYLYRLTMNGRSQTGLVALASCAEYDAGRVKKHEKTRPDKEDDRTRHIDRLGAQTGPVFLLHRARPGIDALWDEIQQGKPDVDFTAPDGIRHTAWVVADPERIERIRSAFAELPAIYVADGHHRSAAAARVARERAARNPSHTGNEPYNFFLTVTFPDNQLQILGYNRLVKDLNGLSKNEFLSRLTVLAWEVRDTEAHLPERRGEFTVYHHGTWRRFQWKPEVLPRGGAPQDCLDVAILQSSVLTPILGIGDPRTDERIAFVGGIRGTAELERRVDNGEFAIAFAMHPVSAQELMAIADAGGLMPPKSTWFEPKLRDGMMVHVID